MDSFWSPNSQAASSTDVVPFGPFPSWKADENDVGVLARRGGKRKAEKEMNNAALPSRVLRSSLRQNGFVQLGFGGCGGMYNYFLGVAAVIQQHFHLDNVIFSGSSAGCFPALLLALGADVRKEFEEWNVPLINHTGKRPLRSLYHWIPDVKGFTMKRLPEDAYKAANYKFYCSVTRLGGFGMKLFTGWDDNEDMIDCMTASGWVSIFGPSLTKFYRGNHCLDGSLTNNCPIPFEDRPAKVIQLGDWRRVWPHWLYVRTCEDWARTQFRWGVQDALDNLSDFDELLLRKKALNLR